MPPDDIDVEKLVSNIEQHGTAEGLPEENTAAPTTEGTVGTNPETGLKFKNVDELMAYKLKYKAADNDVEEDLATIMKRASMGYNYAQNQHRLKVEREAWENERKTYDQQVQEAKALNEKWSKFESYAKENPDWYNHWQGAWDNRENPAALQGQDGLLPTPGSNFDEQKLNALLAERLKPYDEILTTYQQQVAKQQMAAEDKQLDDQINAVRKKYANINFDHTDPETGKSLEYAALEFMANEGIRDFDKAFKAFYHDNLVKLEVERAREAEQKQKADLKKQGIVDIKTSPGSKRQIDTSGMSWDQITELARKDLGINS